MLILGIIAGVILLLVLAGIVYQAAGARRDQVTFPPPGRLIEGLHLHEAGTGEPVVVLEAGIAATSVSWALIQPEVAKFTRVVAYDRAGLGWSDTARSARTPSNIARELKSALDRAGIQGPYILAGHSFGGLVVQRFAALYPESTHGIVLVDPLRAAEWCPVSPHNRVRLDRAIRLSRRGGSLARVGVVRGCLAMLGGGRKLLPRVAGRVASGSGGSGFMDRLAGEIRKLPRETWPVVMAHWQNPKSFEGMAQHLESLPESATEMNAMTALDVPAVVLMASNVTQDPAPALTNARRIVAAKSGHWVQLDEPELVVASIQEMVERCRVGEAAHK